MSHRFDISLRHLLKLGSLAAALVALALALAGLAVFSQMCAAAEPDGTPAAAAPVQTAASDADAGAPAQSAGSARQRGAARPGARPETQSEANPEGHAEPRAEPHADPHAEAPSKAHDEAHAEAGDEPHDPHSGGKSGGESGGRRSAAPAIAVPPEASSVTRHSLRLDGRKIDYTASAGNLLLRDKSGEPNASVFYVAYTVPQKGQTPRPLTFLFNGGPGAGSVFLLIGSFGPKRLHTASPSSTPPAPYTLEDNPDSLLGVTDLVFVDAVGAGLSRVVGHGTGKNFWGVDQDLSAFAQFIDRYLTVNQRWNSPKYLFGESYGTARAAMLAYRLAQNSIAVNGVVLLSSVLDSEAFSPGLDFKSVSYLPSFAAIAWYHDKITPKPASLPAFLDEARAFARGPYAQALAQGDALPDEQRDAIAARVAQFTGLDVGYVKRTRLRLYPGRFRSELLRDQSPGIGRSIGRYDGRFEGFDFDGANEHPDFDASVSAVTSAFDAALHRHFAEDLHFTPADRYVVFNDDALTQWDWKHRAWWGEHLTAPYAGGDLAEAMRQNPHLRVMSLNGYFDLATPFFATEYALAHLGLDPSLRRNIRIAYYPTGHMIYLDDQALHAARQDLVNFYEGGGQ